MLNWNIPFSNLTSKVLITLEHKKKTLLIIYPFSDESMVNVYSYNFEVRAYQLYQFDVISPRREDN